MTKLVVLLLLVLAAPMCIGSAEPERFELSIRRFGRTRIVIELRNTSREAQEIAVLPSHYDGLIVATLGDGTTRFFMNTVFRSMALTGDILWSRVVLWPGDYHRWEHDLAEFTVQRRVAYRWERDLSELIEQRRAALEEGAGQTGASVSTLADVAPLIVSVSTEKDVYQQRSIGPGQRESYKSASLRSVQSNWPPR